MQSITRTLGIMLLVVWVLDCVGSRAGDWGGDSSAENGSDDWVPRSSDIGVLVKVKAL